MGNDINQAATKNQISQLKLSPLSFESQEADILKNKKTVTKAKDNTRRAIPQKRIPVLIIKCINSILFPTLLTLIPITHKQRNTKIRQINAFNLLTYYFSFDFVRFSK